MKKKLLAEMAGTMVLVLMGCGAAVFNGGCGTTQQVLTVAMAFGLSVVAMAYAIGGVSGCHINPAITLGVWLSGRMPGREAAGYMAAQVAVAFVGSLLLYGIVGCVDEAAFVTNGAAMATHTGSNAVAAGVPLLGGLLAEVVFTMVFVLVVLGATSAKHGAGALAGLAIGLSLVLVHIVCIPVTGTSVNPARSLAPAVFDLAYGSGVALQQLWIFILGPFVGAALAAGLWRGIGGKE